MPNLRDVREGLYRERWLEALLGIFLDAGMPKLLFVGVALLQLMIILTGYKVSSIGAATKLAKT